MRERRVGIVADLGEVRRALDVQIVIAGARGRPVLEARASASSSRAAGRPRCGRRRERWRCLRCRLRAPQGQHSLPAAADHDRRMRTLHRSRPARIPGDVDVLTGTSISSPVKCALTSATTSSSLLTRVPGVVECQSHCLVFVAAPTRTEAEFEPTVGEQVERRRLLRENRGDVVVDAEYPAADAQRLGRRRGGGHRRDGARSCAGCARALRRAGPR